MNQHYPRFRGRTDDDLTSKMHFCTPATYWVYCIFDYPSRDSWSTNKSLSLTEARDAWSIDLWICTPYFVWRPGWWGSDVPARSRLVLNAMVCYNLPSSFQVSANLRLRWTWASVVTYSLHTSPSLVWSSLTSPTSSTGTFRWNKWPAHRNLTSGIWMQHRSRVSDSFNRGAGEDA